MNAKNAGYLMAVNCAVFAAPFANSVYAGDGTFWKLYSPFMDWFKGDRYTYHKDAKLYGAKNLPRTRVTGKLDDKGVGGISSGHQAIGAAYYLWRPKVIILTGFDCGWSDGNRKHVNGNHPARLLSGKPGCGNPTKTDSWLEGHRRIACDAERLGVRIINASRETLIKHYPRMTLEQAIHERPD